MHVLKLSRTKNQSKRQIFNETEFFNSSIWRMRMLYYLSFKFWFFVVLVHGVCHLDFGGGNPHVKYLCAVANFYDEYYSVIGPFWIF